MIQQLDSINVVVTLLHFGKMKIREQFPIHFTAGHLKKPFFKRLP